MRECNSVVSLLNLSENEIDDECMKQLGEYVQDNQHLEKLWLGSNKITDKGIEIISEYLIGNTKLKELNLSVNEGITDVSVPYLIEIAKKSCITEIEIWVHQYLKKSNKELKNYSKFQLIKEKF